MTTDNGRSLRSRFDARGADGLGPRHSGRRFVIGAVVVVLGLGGVLGMAFVGWRAGYRERAAFGARMVAPAVVPLKAKVPPGVDPAAWADAVDRTRRMLEAVAAANVLDLGRLQVLRAELAARVARARPETAADALARVWDEMEARAGRVVARHRRPELLPRRRRGGQRGGGGVE